MFSPTVFSRDMFSARRLIAFLCVVAVLLAVTAPAGHGLGWAVLLPLLFFFAIVVIAAVNHEFEDRNVPAFPFLSAVASRAPPSA
jgi:hypothetical protein